MDANVRTLKNPELLGALNMASKAKKEQNADALYESMNFISQEVAMNAKLIAVTQNTSAGVAFAYLKWRDEKNYLAAFTDWDAYVASRIYDVDKSEVGVYSFDDYYLRSKDSGMGIVLNPGTNDIFLEAKQVERMRQIKEVMRNGIAKAATEPEKKMKIGDLKVIPDGLVGAVIAQAKALKGIKAIWLKNMIQDDEERYLLIVDLKGDDRIICATLAQAAGPYTGDKFVNAVEYGSWLGSKSSLGTPIYKKGFSLFS